MHGGSPQSWSLGGNLWDPSHLQSSRTADPGGSLRRSRRRFAPRRLRVEGPSPTVRSGERRRLRRRNQPLRKIRENLPDGSESPLPALSSHRTRRLPRRPMFTSCSASWWRHHVARTNESINTMLRRRLGSPFPRRSSFFVSTVLLLCAIPVGLPWESSPFRPSTPLVGMHGQAAGCSGWSGTSSS